ncbi:threonine ammonia-lyase [Feifania hominis]|uniref:L-threonine dehydratase catabolic TdcB n=1 Tax=Feifania hominis TaxID=2763660 RepID=A0A926DDJ0_9FIRM|nr:threonine ammonia-lyase [Feifania hominis]MBC8535867.1 threonine ammonia-lyase [Feifania hominis]
MLTLDKVYHAAFVLKNTVRRTDLIYSPVLSDGYELYLKTENLQLTGSFKLRGSAYKISQLTSEEKSRGVIACSAGNHAQGVALAAQREGIRATICLPDGAPISKVEATKSYGADVVLVPGVYDDAYNRALELQQEQGSVFIHPFNDEDVIAGQGTIGLELLDQLPDLDAVIVPIGGGGLISGIAFTVKALNPNCKVYGVQAAGAPSMVESLREHKPIELSDVATIADGIAVKHPGDLTYELVNQYVDEVVTVTDDEISSAILALMETQKMVTEGAGAVSVAAAMFHKVDIRGKKVACVLSGGNIDVTILSRVITRGLLKAGRVANMTIALADKPGQLTQVSGIISRLGGNVVSVHHDRGEENTAVTSCVLHLSLETRDHAHVDEIRDALKTAGFHIVAG